MGIFHTYDIKVGNEFVRGVSGGERKRVSIIETLATRGSVYFRDNSTRGFDASTALGYMKAIRTMTDIFNLASILTLYQAGNSIYNLFGKVLLIKEGKELYYGPLMQAQPFMEELGFVCSEGSNVADYLTGVTVPTKCEIRDEFQDTYLRTSDDIQAVYEKSSIHAEMGAEYDYPTRKTAKEHVKGSRETIQREKHKSLPNKSALTVSFYSQERVAVSRQYKILWGDQVTFIIN